MKDYKLHTPEGVRDIIFNECEEKKELETRISGVFKVYGYKNVQTPTYEYYEVYSEERGNIDSTKMYKFLDKEGNILVLRPDITPAIARIIATELGNDNDIIRICYLSNTYRYYDSYQGKLREATQAGVELVGEESPETDAEVISLAVYSLLSTGLKEFKVDIGQVQFFKGLLEEANLDESTGEKLRRLMEEKNYIAVEELLEKHTIEKSVKQLILDMPKMFGKVEILRKTRKITKNKKSLAALDRLLLVYDILCDYGIEQYINFDLGMVNRLNYYTGIIFRGYSYGSGISILDGGRYDSLVSQFGKDKDAVGFGIVINEVQKILKKTECLIKISLTETVVLYNEDSREIALKIVNKFRTEGMIVEIGMLNKDIQSNIEYAKKKGAGGILNFKGENIIEVINVIDGNITETTLDELIMEEI